MYKAVIFDLDGTLLDTIGDLANAANHALSCMGCPTFSVAEYCYMVGNGIPKLLERCLPDDRRTPEDTARIAELFFPYYDEHKQDTTKPYCGIPELLGALKQRGVKLGVVSNKENTLTKSIVAHYFPDTFDAVSGHVPGTPTKPDPHLVNAMRGGFGLSCEEVLFVGDSNVDILTAHNASLAGCGVLWGFRTKQELQSAGADFLAADTAQLSAVICGESTASAL